MNCYFITFGCKVNTCDTAGMQALLRRAGHTIVPEPADADVILFNSCTVTASGDNRLRTAVRRAHRSYPGAFLVLTGCYAQVYPEAAKETMPELHLILGTKDRSRLPELLDSLQHGRQTLTAVTPYAPPDSFESLPCDTMPGNTRAFLKIQDGCDAFCSYCIIPYARGRCRSLSLDAVREHAAAFARKGYQEIVLCGINLGYYGKSWNGSLSDAARICGQVPGIQRVRFGSLEPDRLTRQDLEQLAALPQFCPQFHLSLQSGCDKTLKQMRRHYTSAEYASLCQDIRVRFPGCAITTDLMVGFPGETAEDFQSSLAFAEAIGFAGIHVFRYSPRPGTKAAQMPEQVSDAEKTRRMEQAQASAKAAKRAFLRTQLHQTVPVLFERERGDGFHVGHAPNGTVVRVPAKNSKKSLRNQFFCVTIEESDADCCYGTLPAADANSY